MLCCKVDIVFLLPNSHTTAVLHYVRCYKAIEDKQVIVKFACFNSLKLKYFFLGKNFDNPFNPLQPQVRNGRHARNCKLVVYPFSLHVSVGPVRTTGHAQHITRRTIMCAFAQKDTPGNIAKRVRNLTLYKPRPFPTFNTLHTGIVLIYSNDSCKANLMILSATS